MRAPDTKGDGFWFGGRWYPVNDPMFARLSPPPTKQGSGEVIKAYSFSEADWREIKASLTECGVDLDAVTVGKFVPGARWWLPDDSSVRRSLRDGLQIMAWRYTALTFLSKKSRTPAQVAEGWQKVLAALENACHLLDRTAFVFDDDSDAHAEAYDAMMWYGDELKGRIAKLRAIPSPRIENARTHHNDYWRELGRLWLGITGSAGPLRRKRLHSFLTACTPPGLFPDLTTQKLAHKIDGFISNLSRKQPRPTKSRGA
jgi:hypothetical protein